jgi:small subunit ribosomal protein S15
MSILTAEAKKTYFKEYGGDEGNTGSVEGQIALFTHRIAHITSHLKTNKKDYSSTRSLIRMVGQRRSLLNYLAKKDINKYRALIEKLNLRK